MAEFFSVWPPLALLQAIGKCEAQIRWVGEDRNTRSTNHAPFNPMPGEVSEETGRQAEKVFVRSLKLKYLDTKEYESDAKADSGSHTDARTCR